MKNVSESYKIKALSMCSLALTIAMLVFVIFRFAGFEYYVDKSTYSVNPTVQIIIFHISKCLEAFIIAQTITKRKVWQNILIAVGYCTIYFFIPDSLSFVFDVIYVLAVLPLYALDYKVAAYGIILFAFYVGYQALMLYAKFTVDLSGKYSYTSLVVSLIDYKLYISCLCATINLWRFKLMSEKTRIATPSADETKNYGGGHCFFLFGKFEKFCEVVGKILVGIVTLGIAPLVVHICRKNKKKQEDLNK